MESKKIDEARPVAIDTGKRVDVTAASTKKVVRARFMRPEKPKKDANEDNKTSNEIINKVVAKPELPPEPERKIPLYVEPLEFDESGDFASMLEENFEEDEARSVHIGDKVSGKVIHIGKEHVFVALGPKIEAAIACAEFLNAEGVLTVRVGQKISAYVISTDGGVVLSNDVAQKGLDTAMLQEAYAKKIPIEGRVLATNKGGFEVQISQVKAFCPVGQIDSKFVEDTQSYVGKNLNFLIERFEENGRNVVVSRRALLQREQREQALGLIGNLKVADRYSGVITRVADFGAFVDIGGLEGLIPRSEIAHGHIDRVSDVISSGDRVEVLLLSFDINQENPTKSKLSFSLKKTKEDPYLLHWSKIKEGATLEGRVVRLENFGAFVELFPGIDGLIHISELAENRVTHPKEVLSVGDPVTVRVVTVDDLEKRIGLSLREQVARKKNQDKIDVKLERGHKASGIVSRIERYGVFLELENGLTALLPQSETDLPKHADLHRSFNIGDKIEVVVIDIDNQNRIRVSSLARKQMEERDSYIEFQTEQGRRSSFGTFADLLKKK